MLLEEIYAQARTVRTGRYLTTINGFTDQLKALPPQVLAETAWGLIRKAALRGNTLVGEEDKGAHLTTAISLFSGLPMSLARWYVYPVHEFIEHSVIVPVTSEYYEGKLILNGIEPGDEVIIADDTLSTGGTVCALNAAIRQCGACVTEVLAAVEKVGHGGRERIESELGVPVTTLLRIEVNELGVSICD